MAVGTRGRVEADDRLLVEPLARQPAQVTSVNTLGLRCARFARWPPQARERGSSGRASDTASPGWRRALAAS